jgi:4-hydroxybenzoate polyprenyltransferase
MSSIELIRAYVVERYPARRFLPLAVVLSVVGVLGGERMPSLWRAIAGIGVAFASVLALRILDDTADLDRDRRNHPGRVTVTAPSLWPLWVLAAVVFCALLVRLAARDPSAEPALLLLGVGLGLVAWYVIRSPLGAGPLVNAHVVHLKYPLIALVAGASGPIALNAPTIAALAALYFGLCIREALDDPQIRGVRASRWVIGVELTLLAGLLLTLSTGGLQS